MTELGVFKFNIVNAQAELEDPLATKGYTVDRALVLAEANVKRDGDVLYLPIYMAGLLETQVIAVACNVRITDGL